MKISLKMSMNSCQQSYTIIWYIDFKNHVFIDSNKLNFIKNFFKYQKFNSVNG